MRSRALLALATLGFALAGCSLAPVYPPPLIEQPVAFKEAGPWTAAMPADQALKGDWWALFGDPVLTDLEQQVATANPTIKGALGRYEQAQGYLGEVRSSLLPTIGVQADITQNRQSDHRPLRSRSQPNYYAADTIGGSIAFDLDLWGRLRNSVAAGRAEVEASGDDLAAIRLGLEAQLALQYVQLRGLDAQAKLLSATVDAYTQADDLTQRRFKGGIASGIDISRSGALLADARAQLADVAAARALVEHAIASLVGKPATLLAIAPSNAAPVIPVIPAALPSTLLQRRPDIAAAERRMFEANAGIGVAKAAFFPSLSIGGGGGFQNTGLSSLISAPNSFWSVGPNAILSIFDGGRRRAQLAVARAAWSEATASYRERVLQAFQDVEDGLAQTRHYADEARNEADAVRLAGETEQLSLNRYVKGAVTYLDVSTAQETALQVRRKALDLNTQRLAASVRLIRALGGGWNAQTPVLQASAGGARPTG